MRDLISWNRACIIKLAWILFFRQYSIWAKWYTTEVLDGDVNNYWVINTKKKHSQAWFSNKLIKMRDLVFPWIKMVVGNGKRCLFWTSNWSPFGRMDNYLGNKWAISSGIRSTSTLADLWHNGQWCLPPARSDAQVNLQVYLSTLQLTELDDYFEWRINGVVKTSYATVEIYQLLKDHGPKVAWSKEVWNTARIPRHQFLTWLFVLNRCPTMDRLISWGLQSNPICVLCNTAMESRNHMFFACGYSLSLWTEISRRCSITPTPYWDLTLQFLHSLPIKGTKKKLALLGWQSVIYTIWSERNHRIHRSTFKPVNILLKNINVLIRNRASSFWGDRPKLASALLQPWFSTSI